MEEPRLQGPASDPPMFLCPSRTVVCSDPDMTLPPVALPADTRRLRLERTAVRRLPAEAFRALGRLEQLWLPYNALGELSALLLRGLRRLRELRLPGNRLAAFPWAALRDAPQLRLLDLQANRLAAVPAEAARFLGNLTFLDLSSNQLLRLPQELLLAWAQLKSGPFLPGLHARLVLGKRWPGGLHLEPPGEPGSWPSSEPLWVLFLSWRAETIPASAGWVQRDGSCKASAGGSNPKADSAPFTVLGSRK